MFKRIDQSPALARFLEFISSTVAKQRGLPVLIGILFIIISFALQSVEILSPSPLLEWIGVAFLHVGLIIALIGLLVSEALGK